MRNRRFSISLVVIITIVIGIFAGTSSLPSAHAALPNPILWATKAALPYPIAQAGVISGLDGRIFVMGGYSHASPSTPNSTARAYDPRTDSWTTLTSMGTPTRGPGIAIDQNGLIYVISGYSGSADITAVQVYNVTSNSWSTGTPIPTGVWMPGATTGRDGRIYVAGGEPSGTVLQIYNPQTKVWTSGASMSTSRKQFQAVAAPNGLIYAIGGMTAGDVAMATVEAYNITSNSWSAKASLPTAVSVFGATLGPDGLIYVFGGSNTYSNNSTPYYNSVYSYYPATNTWLHQHAESANRTQGTLRSNIKL
jgi:N-acetylneuraminic acid mutarotase